MRYPNAFEGIKKVFLAQILALIGSVCTALGAVTGGIGIVAGSTASGVSGGFFILAGLVLSILSLIFSLMGLYRASQDEESFRKAFIYSLVNLILSVILSVMSMTGIGGAVVSNLSGIISTILGIIVIAYVFKGIEALAHALKREDVAVTGQKVLTFLWVVYGVTIFCDLMSLLFPNSAGVMGIIGILGILAGIAMIVGYILYLVHLNRAKVMLAEGR